MPLSAFPVQGRTLHSQNRIDNTSALCVHVHVPLCEQRLWSEEKESFCLELITPSEQQLDISGIQVLD